MRYAGINCILTPIGSAGDVLPFIGIGRRLKARGHEVTVLTAEPFKSAVERSGLRFVATQSTADFERVTRHPDLWHPRKGVGLVLRELAANLRVAFSTISDVYDPGRTVLVGHTLAIPARVFEEKRAAPAVTVHLAPGIIRSAYLSPAVDVRRDIARAPRWLKRTLLWLADRLILDPHISAELNTFRAELGLPSVHRIFNSWLHSPRRVIGLFPDWYGPPQPDWPTQVRLTGFPLFDDGDDVALDQETEEFIHAGDPPIVFTPGSGNRQAPAFFSAALEASAILQRRALLLTPYPEQLPSRLPRHAYHASYAPFSRVLPNCAAIVHHGGVGTCAQGLAAGIPQLTMPMGFDQPDNATRLRRLGVGDFLPPSKFRARRLAGALHNLLDSSSTSQACRRYREELCTAKPLDETCRLIEEAAA